MSINQYFSLILKMKLLVFSDLHCHTGYAKGIVEKAANADVIIGAGDFATVRRNIHKTIDILKNIQIPTVVVPGNNESLEELQQACEGWNSVHILHGNAIEIAGWPIFGIGGGIPVTPFGSWSYDFSEKEAAELLQNCPAEAIIISHSPPKGAVDVSSSGQSLGSTAVYETILNKNPKLVVCGHIHESGGQKTHIQQTLVINAGPEGQIIEL